ncbi:MULTISPECIES: hypothetical protein [unclassified Haladaptatus]|uniref:DUF7268 family protein n=1 Tax=unclassified Haladaptatus TaxID=2622732 RepID=UPI00209C2071|nr:MULTISPECIES: hypothetical protein [unclassified Haladaptatus]MCO8246881.1 hypothetical protein [Haladaptatus sp. AB643]MCO8253593.1 hypothetical protein [Haladaptatus sp. AB618]
MDFAGYLRPRIRLIVRFGLFGIVLSSAAMLLVVVTGETVSFASRKTFAVATLAFGFAILGWSGSVFAGSAIENVQEHLDTNSNWTEAGSRRAMTAIGSFGAGGMLGVVVMTTVLRAAH